MSLKRKRGSPNYTVFDVRGSFVFNQTNNHITNGNNNRPTPVGEPTKANIQKGVHEFVNMFIADFKRLIINQHWVRTQFKDDPKQLSNNLNGLERDHPWSLRCSVLWNETTQMVDALLVYRNTCLSEIFCYEGNNKYHEKYKIEYLFASPMTRGAGQKLLFKFLEQKSGKNVFLYNSTFNNTRVTTNGNYKKASFYTKLFNFRRLEENDHTVLVYNKGKNSVDNLPGAPKNRNSIDFKVR